MGLIFFARVAWMDTGCVSGPSDGTLGGKCVAGCNHDTCSDGSVCDEASDICVSPSTVSNTPSYPLDGAAATCEAVDSSICPSEYELWQCAPNGALPYEDCSWTPTDASTATFCCARSEIYGKDAGDE